MLQRPGVMASWVHLQTAEGSIRVRDIFGMMFCQCTLVHRLSTPLIPGDGLQVHWNASTLWFNLRALYTQNDSWAWWRNA
jgi:hypothetical protein